MRYNVVEVEQETSAPPPKKTPGSAPGINCFQIFFRAEGSVFHDFALRKIRGCC